MGLQHRHAAGKGDFAEQGSKTAKSHHTLFAALAFPRTALIGKQEQGRWRYLLGGLLSAHNLQQGHNVGGAEEVCANDAVLRLGLLSNELNVNGGGIG